MDNDPHIKDLVFQPTDVEDIFSNCPFCACLLNSGEDLHLCEICGTPHHRDCWEFTGGCAIFGCLTDPSSKSGQSENKLMQDRFTLPFLTLWGQVLYADSVTFLVIATSFLLFPVLFFALSWAVLFNSSVLIYVITIFLFFALFSFVLALPLNIFCFIGKRLMGLHFVRFGSTPPHIDGKLVNRAIEKVALPEHLFAFSNFLHRLAGFLSPCMVYGSIAFPFVVFLNVWFFSAFVPPSPIFMLGLFLSHIFCSLFIWHFASFAKHIIDYELVLCASYQNRLVASTKFGRLNNR
jgi:hypothetical protein